MQASDRFLVGANPPEAAPDPPNAGVCPRDVETILRVVHGGLARMKTTIVLRSVLAVGAALLALTAGPAGAQSADQEVVSVVDSPDPVIPGQNLSYTVTMRNNGPDVATNGGLNLSFDQNLTVVSLSPPSGYACAQFGSNISCTTPSFAPGTVTMALVFQVGPHLNNFPDGTLTSNFSPSGTTPDPNSANNFKQAVTAWDSPQVDLSIAVTDTPDPVAPDGTITYSVTATNAGPDPATSANFNVFNNGSLRFQSVSAASGFTCAPPAVGSAPTFTCSRGPVPVGTYAFTVVVLADDAVIGVNDATVSTVFAFGANGSHETNNANNSETESTAYVAPDADLSVTVVELPDPAYVEAPIDFLVELANAGPDPAVQARLNIVGDGGLQFVSIAPPPGFTCTSQAVGATPLMTCTHPSLPAGPPVEFLLRLRSDEDVLGEDGGVVVTNFGANSNVVDPFNANNSETETTTVVSFRLLKDGFEPGGN